MNNEQYLTLLPQWKKNGRVLLIAHYSLLIAVSMGGVMVITQTPLRISLAGGGTDFRGFYEQEDGFVVSSAIDKYVFVIVKERFDDGIYINYMKKEIVDYVDEIQHELVREAMKITGVEHGVEITMLADVPSEGSGLGSSSSITVGLLNALYMYHGEQVPAERLAREACDRFVFSSIASPFGEPQHTPIYEAHPLRSPSMRITLRRWNIRTLVRAGLHSRGGRD